MLNITKRLLRPALVSNIGVTRVGLTRSFSVVGATRNGQNDDDDETKQGFLKSVLYGKEQQNGVSIPGDNTTHSKKLARGKYVHEKQSKLFKKLCAKKKRERKLKKSFFL